MTYSDLLAQYLVNIGQDGSTDSGLISEFNSNLGNRYKMVMAKMRDYMTQQTKTTSTIAGLQYYNYPIGLTNIEGTYITIGSVNYPVTVVNSQFQWNWLNALQVQPTAIPQFIFPRKFDFGIYPIPQSAYTLTFDYHYKDRNLSVADYVTGTLTITNASSNVIGSGTSWTPAMIGRWLEVTDTTNSGQGYFYQIADVPNATTITLATDYEGATGPVLTYRIGEVPDFPDEGHILLIDGPTADFYAGRRHDVETATWFDNKFFTGSGKDNRRLYGNSEITGGLIGLYNSYTDRNNERVIERNKRIQPFQFQNWGMNLTGA